MNTKIRRLSAFNYFGGKNRHLDWILPLFPDHDSYLHYVEPFCGSAALFLNKKPSKIETINDLNANIINFFKVLRSHPEELITRLQLTPYSRAEFMEAIEDTEDPIERARRYFVRCMQSFGSAGESTYRISSWRTQFTESRKGMSLEVSKWFSKIQGLWYIINRLSVAQIDNRDAIEIIEKYDSEQTFFFIDPPYLFETRTGKKDYKHEISFEYHEQLAKVLNQIKGKAMICSYPCATMDSLYPPLQWQRIAGPNRRTNLGKSDTPGTREHVWINYPLNSTLKLF